jgi:hypothetical protein
VSEKGLIVFADPAAHVRDDATRSEGPDEHAIRHGTPRADDHRAGLQWVTHDLREEKPSLDGRDQAMTL